MEQRRTGQVGVIGRQPGQRHDLLAEEVHLRVRHRHALGRAGRAGSEEDRGQAGRIRIGQRPGERSLQQFVPGCGVPSMRTEQIYSRRRGAGVDDPELLNLTGGRFDGDEPFGENIVNNRPPRLDGHGLVPQEFALVCRVDRDLDEAANRGSEPAAYKPGRVGRHDQHAVTRGRARLVPRGCGSFCVEENLGVRPPTALLGRDQACRRRLLGRVTPQHSRQAPVVRVGEDRMQVLIFAHHRVLFLIMGPRLWFTVTSGTTRWVCQ